MKAKTAAEQQIEALRQMKEAKSRRKAVAVPPAPKEVPPLPKVALAAAKPLMEGAPPAAPAVFELAEAVAPTKRTDNAGPSLPLSRDTWRKLRQRQRETHEFRKRRDMGEWAAELLLALPPNAHKLGPEAKAELFKRMDEWCRARGLR